MARKRMIDPNIWQSEDFSKLNPFERLVFIGLFSHADDAGRGRAKASYLKSSIFPYDEKIKVAEVDRALESIAKHMSVIFYEIDGGEYYTLINWGKWQKVEKPTDSIIPAYYEGCTVIRGGVGEESGMSRGRVGEESRLIEEKRSKEKRSKENIREEGTHAPEKLSLADNVKMTQDEYNKLIDKYGNEATDWMIKKLDSYKGAKGTTYKSDYRAILNWVADAWQEYEKKQGRASPQNPFFEAARKMRDEDG